jgi:hypothetical protein
MNEFDAIRARRAAITPGPWTFCEDLAEYDAPGWLENGELSFLAFHYYNRSDVEFIAAAPADIDALLVRVAALERVLVDVDGVLQRAQDACDRAAQPARAQDCYIARQQIAALFPPPD